MSSGTNKERLQQNNIQLSNHNTSLDQILDAVLKLPSTEDATATAADIMKDKTAYVDGQKITGTLEITESADAPVKLFETVDDMNADATMEKDDLAMVYDAISYNHPEVGDDMSPAYYMNTITLPEAITEETTYTMASQLDTAIFTLIGTLTIALTPTSATLTIIAQNDSYTLNVASDTYTSTDGITYTNGKKGAVTKVDTTVSGVTMSSFGKVTAYDGHANLFFAVDVDTSGKFDGAYKYDTEWKRLDLDTSDATATADDILLGKTAYVNGTKLEGLLEKIDNPVLQFSSIDSMNAFTGKNGDMAVVYKAATSSGWGSTTTSREIYFPPIVTLESPIEESLSFDIGKETAGMTIIMGRISITPESFVYRNEMDTGNVEYTSSDGITYIRTDESADIISYDMTVGLLDETTWNNVLYSFLRTNYIEDEYIGLYMYLNSSWKKLDENTLTIIPSTEDQVYNGSYSEVSVAGDVNLVSENILKGKSIFNVEGSVVALKIFETDEDRESSIDNVDGDLSITYGTGYVDLEIGKTYTSLYLPPTIVFDTARTSTYYIYLNNESTSSVNATQCIVITSKSIKFAKKGSFFGPTTLSTITYESSDGITYTRTDTLGECVTISEIYSGSFTTVTIQSGNHSLLTQMFKGEGQVYDGTHEYKTDTWVRLDVDTSDANATASDMVLGKTAYVNKEKVEGTIPEFTPDTDDVQGEYIDDCIISNIDDDTQLMGIKVTTAKDLLVREGSFIRGDITYDHIVTWLGLSADMLAKGTTLFGVEGTAGAINNQDKTITTNGTYTADDGYTGLGTVTVNVETVMSQEDYDICNNLASLILSDTALLDDPNIKVTLDVTQNDTVTIENNTLVIQNSEEV